jgi:hypothetical protein
MGYRGPNVNFPEDIHPELSKDPTPWQAEEIRRKGSSVVAVVGFSAALVALWLVYFRGPTVAIAAILGVLGSVLSSIGWRYAAVRNRPAGLAVAGVLLGASVAIIAILRLS